MIRYRGTNDDESNKWIGEGKGFSCIYTRETDGMHIWVMHDAMG